MRDPEPTLSEIVVVTRADDNLPPGFEIQFVVDRSGAWLELVETRRPEIVRSIVIGQDPDLTFAEMWFSLVNLARDLSRREPIDWRRELEQ